MESHCITSPDDPQLEGLCQQLAEWSDALDLSGRWPAEQLRLCGEYGVFEWFLPNRWGGQGWGEADILRGYLRLSAACLTTTFVITQRTGACRRIASSRSPSVPKQLLPSLVRGTTFATVGISHLTTSRRHLVRPVLRAERHGDRFVLDGYSPWVTGAAHAETLVLGATLEERGATGPLEMLVALPTDSPGVEVAEPARLVGLSASHTGAVELERVEVDPQWVLAGPVEKVMSHGAGATTGGLQTSTLALGLARAALEFLGREAQRRSDLAEPAEHLLAEHTDAERDLLALASGQQAGSSEQLRRRANSLALRAAQAALAAAKGSGYVAGHPAGRWCREALFFLVWSCPQSVTAANLCELAGIESG